MRGISPSFPNRLVIPPQTSKPPPSMTSTFFPLNVVKCRTSLVIDDCCALQACYSVHFAIISSSRFMQGRIFALPLAISKYHGVA